nr:NAD(P)-dependent alcohol dehydrogenase [Chitinophagaceae bacterium]
MEKMKAVVCRAYGPPEVLVITQTDKPVPRKGEVLVKIMATAVNSADIRVRGLQVQGWLRLVMRLVLGFTKPRKPVLGTVLAGVVEATGDKVSRFKPGDEVFAITGFRFGTYASYACLPQHGTILHKPAGSTFEEAATILFGGMTALYFLEKAGLLKRQRPRVLVYGATGSVGAAAVEIARYHQARVTSVCSEEGLPLARALG